MSTLETYRLEAEGDSRGLVVAIDLGMKRDILRNLTSRGFDIEVVPAATTAGDILASDPVGVFVSNGPGDPEPLRATTETIQGLIGERPLFGICLGHQVLGLAVGAHTFKLPFGHHGGNHPVQDVRTGEIDITSHNHGFAVREGKGRVVAGAPGLDVTHVNLYDGTVEGFAHRERPLFAVQYHPEAAPGPHDALHHIEAFVATMRGGA